MTYQINLLRRIFFAATTLAALGGFTSACADEASSETVAATPAISESLNKNPVFNGAQAIRNMVKSIGPEAAMDMMFSSIDPVCQKTLLSKTTAPAKAPASIEEMRDNRYLQPAIVVNDQSTQWAKATPDGRNQIQVFNWMDPKNYFGWLRMNKPAGETPQQKAASVPPPQRY